MAYSFRFDPIELPLEARGEARPILPFTRSPATWSLMTSTHRTAGGPARPVVWEGRRGSLLLPRSPHPAEIAARPAR